MLGPPIVSAWKSDVGSNVSNPVVFMSCIKSPSINSFVGGGGGTAGGADGPAALGGRALAPAVGPFWDCAF